MTDFGNHIEEIKLLVEDLNQKLSPFKDKKNRIEKEVQLKSIEKTISQLQKGGTSIPDELRELKFKLLKEIDEFKEAEAAEKKLHNLLSEFLPTPKKKPPIKKKKTQRRSSNSRITIADLLEKGVLWPEAQLIKEYKGTVYKAVIDKNGLIKVLTINNDQQFGSPSTAAVAITNKPINGWTWWKVSKNGSEKILDHYRKKYINETK
jgi:DNA-binding transcriptional MerR regulator